MKLLTKFLIIWFLLFPLLFVHAATVPPGPEPDEKSIQETLSFINQSSNLAKLDLGSVLQHHLTRAEAAKLLYGILSLKNASFKLPYPLAIYSNPFADVDKNSDYYMALLTLAYYKGSNNDKTVFTQKFGVFNPLRNITRAEFVKIILEGFDIPITKDISVLSEFVDGNKISTQEMKEYFATAVREEIIRGETINGNRFLQPYRELTIREGLLIIGRALDRIVKVSEDQFLPPLVSLDNVGKRIGGLPEIQHYNPDATFKIENVDKRTTTNKDYENCTILYVKSKIVSNSDPDINEFYRWETNFGYFVKATSNNKEVIFCPTTRKPVVDYQIKVVGTDGLGNFDEYKFLLDRSSFKYDQNIADDDSIVSREIKLNDIKIFPLETHLKEGELFRLRLED
jgi:hypothetical protein